MHSFEKSATSAYLSGHCPLPAGGSTINPADDNSSNCGNYGNPRGPKVRGFTDGEHA